MIHFQSKENMVDWLINNCPRPAIVRALEQGRVEFLGGFKLIPPSTLPGWILQVNSIYGKCWNIAVLANDIKHIYEIRIMKSVPWKNWIGTNSHNKLFCGDNPETYKELKNGS